MKNLRRTGLRLLTTAVLTALGVSGVSAGTGAADPAPQNIDATEAPRGEWESVGPNSLGGLLAVTDSPDRLALMQPGPPVLWVSDDRGASWTPRRGLPVNYGVSGLFVNPDNDNQMLVLLNRAVGVGVWSGALVSTVDRGETWHTLRTWDSTGAFQMATDPTGLVVVVEYLDGLSVSTNGGKQWRDIPRAWPRQGTAAPAGDRKLALVGDDVYLNTVAPEFSTWAVRGITSEQPIQERLLDPAEKVNQLAANEELLTVTIGPELHGSTDGGRTWTVLRQDPDGKDLLEPVFVGDRLYVNTYHNLDVSTDDGATWTRGPVPAAGQGVTDIASLPGEQGEPATTLVSALYRGVYADEGEGRYRQLGVAAETMGDLVVSGYLGRQHLFAAGTSEVFDTELPRGKVTPETRVWQRFETPRLHNAPKLSVSAKRPNAVWHTTTNGYTADVFRTVDNGRNWELVKAALPGRPTRLLVHPGNPDLLLISSFTLTGGNVVFRSADAGRTWETLPVGGLFTTFAGDLWNPDRVWAGSQRIGLWRSDDAGRTWTQVSQEPTNTITVDHWPTGRILVGGNGILLSTDQGMTFQRVLDGSGNPAEISQIVAHPIDPRVWYAARTTADGAGVVRSTDFGRTWSPLASAVPDIGVKSLAIDGTGNYLFASTQLSGVYRLKLR